MASDMSLTGRGSNSRHATSNREDSSGSGSGGRTASHHNNCCKNAISLAFFIFVLAFAATNIYISILASTTHEFGSGTLSVKEQKKMDNMNRRIQELQSQLERHQEEAQYLKRELEHVKGLNATSGDSSFQQELQQLKEKWKQTYKLKQTIEKHIQEQQDQDDSSDDEEASPLWLKEKVEKLQQKTNRAKDDQYRLLTQILNLGGWIKKLHQQFETKPETKQHNKDKKNKKPMNILLLYADDWRYDTLGIAGNAVVKTPTLDQLAQEGMRFTENCVTTSVCWCSRATLFSGLYTSRHKTFMPQKGENIASIWQDCIYRLLAEAGYYVGHAGKWGVYMPFDKRIHFDIEEDGWHYEERGGRWWHITEKNQHDALTFLQERDKDKPFFINVAFYATHAIDSDKEQYFPQNRSMSMYVDDKIPNPQTNTDESWKRMPYFFDEGNEGRTRWRWRYENYKKHQHMMKNYYRMATEVDTACASIIEEVKRQGELDNTLIIFTTDNGNFHAEHGLADKWYPHRESIRVPLIIKDPRMPADKAGTLNHDYTLNIDLAPTILSAAGITPPRAMMGRDMSELYLKDTNEWRTEFLYEHPTLFARDFIPKSEALVRKDYKYMWWPEWEVEQLFDLKADPIEDNDIVNSTDTEHKEKLEEMRNRFHELKAIILGDEHVTL